ncbi:MAG: hypothetical protein IPG71_01555 [bacterium]|nr:hypothetical protein [bacterium]
MKRTWRAAGVRISVTTETEWEGQSSFFSGADTVSHFKFDGNTSYLVWDEEGTEEWNTLSTFGAALYCYAEASPYIVNSVFAGNDLNRGIQYGTGSVLYSAGGSPSFEFCTMYDNSASGHPGGVIFMDGGSLTMTSCIVSHSTASCAIYFDLGATGDIEYCDFFGLSGQNFRGVPPVGLGTISTTNVNGDTCDQYFNLYVDPEYADAANGDLHLGGTSACVNAADPASMIARDFDGTARPSGAFSDIGAYERGALVVDDLVIYHDTANNDILLNWGAVPGASGYEIYAGDTQEYEPGNSVLIGTTAATTFTDDDVLLTATEQRTYVVFALP